MPTPDKSAYAAELEQTIEREYRRRGDRLGWRLLYSPVSVLDRARVAFIGLNPGGDHHPADHAEFAMASGSAYERESWDNQPAGYSKLQRQVRALFDKISERPEDALAGNLVPFRSPSWKDMENKQTALAFGKAIWTDILARTEPEIVIGMGNDATNALAEILDARLDASIPVNWGTVQASQYSFPGGRLVGIPHLSRFTIMTRPESEAALRRLFP